MRGLVPLVCMVLAVGCAPTSATLTAPPIATTRPTARPAPGAATSAPQTQPALTTHTGRGPTGPTVEASVTRIVDGDTIEVEIAGRDFRVRYVGINAPEWNAGVDDLAGAATDANRDLVRHQTLVLEKDVSESDRFGRLLRHVWLERDDGWTLVNLELVRGGYAFANSYPPDVSRDDIYDAAEGEARAAGRGIWANR